MYDHISGEGRNISMLSSLIYWVDYDGIMLLFSQSYILPALWVPFDVSKT